MKNRERKLLIAVAVCILIFVGDRFLFTPLMTVWKANSVEITNLTLKTAKDRTLIAQADQWKSRKAAIEDAKLPDDPSAAESQVVTSVTQWAQKSQLNLRAVRPLWEKDRKTDEQRRLKLRVSGVGSLYAITQFLHAIETADTPLRVESVKIRSNNDRGTSLELDADISGILVKGVKEGA